MELKLDDISAHERYKLLIGLVIPRPIAWISTWSANGVANCAPFSFFNVFSEDPPLCVIGINPHSKRISEEHYRPIGRLFADRYCTTRQRFNLPGDLPA